MTSRFIVIALAFFLFSCGETQKTEDQEGTRSAEITFLEQEADKRIDVMIDGKLFTSYRWPDDIMKPVLYPLLTSEGTAVTRGFPEDPREGERVDHPHHVGLWFNYGNVDGYDFWNNSYAISEEERNKHYGKIEHRSIEQLSPGTNEGSLIANESWIDPSGKELMTERTAYHFIVEDSVRIIDRITTLTATDDTVFMKDSKEGLLGIRVARQLELPSDEAITLTDDQGNPTTVKKMSNDGVTGNYKSSEGVTGENVWGTRARWMDLYGTIGTEKISLVICDHPRNFNYPTYWHARGYGLFAANPLGVKEFTKGKEELNYAIPAGKSVTFRHRIIISSGSHLTNDEINVYADEFAGKY